MKSVVGLVVLSGICLATACQTTVNSANHPSTSTSPVATQAAASFPSAVVPTPTTFAPVTWNGDGPVFIAVVQKTEMADESADKPTVNVGPVGFAFDLDNRVLWLHRVIPATSLESGVIVGLVTLVETPTVIYEKREILQGPSQPRFMQIGAADAATDGLSFVYDGQTYSLLPGDSLSFDKPATTSKSSTFTTVITNHGRLTGAQSMPADDSLP